MTQYIRTQNQKYPNSITKSISGQHIRVSNDTITKLQIIRSSDLKIEVYNNPNIPVNNITLTFNQLLLIDEFEVQVLTNSDGTFQSIDNFNLDKTNRVLTFNSSTYVELKFLSTFIEPPDIEINGLFILSVQCSANIENFRSLTIKAYAKLDNINQIQNNLRSGTEITIDGEVWVVSTLEYSVMKRTENRTFDVEITLNLNSKISAYQQKISWLDNSNPSRVIDFNTLANRNKVKSELPEYKIVIPENGIYGQTIDWFTYAKDIANINGGIVLYRDSIKFVPIVGITQPQLKIKDSKIRSSITYTSDEANNNISEFHQLLSYKGKNFEPRKFTDSGLARSGHFQGILPILHKPFQYYRAELTGDIYLNDDDAINSEFLQSQLQNKRFLRKTRRYSRIESGSTTFPRWINGTKIVDSVSISFDQSGYVQTYSIKETLDGKPLRERRWEYGFVVTGQDIKNKVSLLSTWKPYEYRETSYEYVGSYGYYVGERTTGWTLTRETQEDIREPEGFDLENDNSELDQYSYIQIPINSGKYLELQKSDDFYPTTDDPLQGYYIDERGILKEDPTYVPIWLVMLEEEYNIAYKVYQSENNGLIRYSGKEYIKRIERKIYNTIKTSAPWFLNSSHFSAQEKQQIEEQEQYSETITQLGAQDEQFRNNLGIGEDNLISGRPPQGDRLPSLYETFQQNDETNKPTLLKDIYPKVYITSTNYNGASRHTVSVSSARTLNDVLMKLKLDWILNNAKANSVKFTIDYNINIYEGLLLEVQIDGILLYGFVLSYSHKKSKVTINKSTGKISDKRYSETDLTIGLVNLDDLANIDTIISVDKLQRKVSLFSPYYVGTRIKGTNKLTASTANRFN